MALLPTEILMGGLAEEPKKLKGVRFGQAADMAVDVKMQMRSLQHLKCLVGGVVRHVDAGYGN